MKIKRKNEALIKALTAANIFIVSGQALAKSSTACIEQEGGSILGAQISSIEINPEHNAGCGNSGCNNGGCSRGSGGGLGGGQH